MKIELRENEVVITGYVNAIERYSKPITERLKGKIQTFIERIRAGVFRKALKENDDVKVLLNHNAKRELATTKDGSARLEEDNIGLRAEVTIKDKEVIEKAREGKLTGWSFGFLMNSEEVGSEGTKTTRTITDLDLKEVSILDDTHEPAYYGTSIEAREINGKYLEIRDFGSEEEPMEEEKKEPVVEEEPTIEESNDEEPKEETEEEKIEKFAEIVANKVIEKMSGVEEEKTIPEEEESTEEEQEDTEPRSIDYSDYESRIAKVKRA